MAMSEVQHIITAAPFTPVNMEPIFLRAHEMREADNDNQERRELASKLIGFRAVNLFYQESTRTRVSFELAEAALGIGYSTSTNARQFSSAAKGETLDHTIKVIEEYNPDFVVLRYDEVGGAAEAASVLKKSNERTHIINAGDGPGEHPTQAYLDAFTILTDVANLLPNHAIINHPMPIDRSDVLNSEIAPDVDRHPRSRFYRQAGNGVYVRMALLEALAERKPIIG
jgi:aspartate carbamoyltransferase catalytic subunit